MILLDTDVVVDLLRELPEAVTWFESLADEEIILPGFAAMELIQGCRSRPELRMVQRHLGNMMVAWPTPETCDAALAVYAKTRFSHGIGLLDALVGQLAISLGLPLNTFNRKHYAGIPNLRTAQPYSR